MTITTLTALKENPLIMTLNEQQSLFDNQDPEILKGNFTRSPYHALTFLIAYAGLTDEQKVFVLKNLNNHNIQKQALDDLIQDIEWKTVLVATEDTLSFEFSIDIADKNIFLEAIKDKCASLYEALNNHDCFVTINKGDVVKFTTKINQDELWEEPFDRGNASKFWEVPRFELSPVLIDLINTLKPCETVSVGVFRIRKGEGELENQHVLNILAPENSNEFSIENKLTVNAGIYLAFQGLKDVYGLESVDEVIVELESQANFSDKGASASQTQVVTLEMQSFMARGGGGVPTIITVSDLHVLFHGADLFATFLENPHKTDLAFNPDYSINLPTKSETNTGIVLFSKMPTPNEAFLVNANRNKIDRKDKIVRELKRSRHSSPIPLFKLPMQAPIVQKPEDVKSEHNKKM